VFDVIKNSVFFNEAICSHVSYKFTVWHL